MSRVQSIERAFAVLSALGDGPSGVTTIAGRARLPKSTVVRLLRALQAEDAVLQDAGDGRYRLGPRVVTLAAGLAASPSLLAVARPHLAELAAATGEAAGLSIPDGRDVHYVEQVDTPNPVSIRDWTGSRIPMHAVSSGQVFLAHLSSAALEAFLERPLEALTPADDRGPGGSARAAARGPAGGYAWVHDEFAEGISSVAAGIADVSGEVVAALHVHGPSYRFPPPGREPTWAGWSPRPRPRIARTLRQTSG